MGHAFIARAADGRMFDSYQGHPERLNPGWSATDAIWAGARALREAGVTEGTVAIFAELAIAPSVAFAPVGHVPYFGSLKWEADPGVTISGEALAAVGPDGVETAPDTAEPRP